jgi:hypothetical protein
VPFAYSASYATELSDPAKMSEMSTVRKNGRGTGDIIGKGFGFMPGGSSNKGGRFTPRPQPR